MTPETVYTVHPDVVTRAIKLLCWVIGIAGGGMVVLGGGLIRVLLYIWGKADLRMTNVELKMDNIAQSIEGMDKSTSVEIAGIKLRCSLLHAGEPHAHIRGSDLIDGTGVR